MVHRVRRVMVVFSTSERNARRRERKLRSRDYREKRDRHFGRPTVAPVNDSDLQKHFEVDANGAIAREGRRRIKKPSLPRVAYMRLYELMDEDVEGRFIPLDKHQLDEAAAYVREHDRLPNWIRDPNEPPDYWQEASELGFVHPTDHALPLRALRVA